jgi:hypothetical protein
MLILGSWKNLKKKRIRRGPILRIGDDLEIGGKKSSNKGNYGRKLDLGREEIKKLN